ncbi:MAG TPA: hypothetical protein VGI06_10490 [Acidimicrobiales bacterium]|jgi:hypothetical protein
MYEHERRWGPLTLVLVIAAGIVVGGVLLSTAFWVLHLVAGLVLVLLRLAVLVGLAAAVVWAVRFVFRDRQRA